MPISKSEATARELVEALHQALDVQGVDSIDVLRAAALGAFAKELEGKLRNLQPGERLQTTYRIDIIGTDGKVRGGSGSQRNMPDYIEWRKAVYERDNYTCQECGHKGGKLNAHHIKPWFSHPDLRFDVANGVTLCEDCHANKHPHLRFIKRG
jgi:hypothetical protein